MAAFYLKGVAPPHVYAQPDLRRHDAVLGIQVLALILLYMFPDIGLWLPKVLYN